jgi:hypothetical protein
MISSENTLQSFRLEIAPRALARTGVGIDRGRLEVGMAEGRRHKGDRRAIVDCMAGVACRSQWTETAGLTPARLAAALTM